MTVTRGRLGDRTKQAFFRTDEEVTGAPGAHGPVAETSKPLVDESARAELSSGSLDSERQLRLGWSRGLLALWTIIMVSTFFEPAPNPNATVPLWANVLGFLFLTGIFSTVWGLAGNHKWGLKASLAAATLGLGMAVACGVTDHHPAFWWGYETVAMTGLLAFNKLALKKTSH